MSIMINQIISVFSSQTILDSKKRVFSWGFGGYGRLGHAEPKDEMVPRLIKFFDGPNRGASMIAGGSLFTFALSEHGKYGFSLLSGLRLTVTRRWSSSCPSLSQV